MGVVSSSFGFGEAITLVPGREANSRDVQSALEDVKLPDRGLSIDIPVPTYAPLPAKPLFK